MAGYWVVVGLVAFTLYALLNLAGVLVQAGDREGVRTCVWLAGATWIGLVAAVFNLVVELSERGL